MPAEAEKIMQLLAGHRVGADAGPVARGFARRRGRSDLVRQFLRGRSGMAGLDGNRSTRSRAVRAR
jgi:hypothetical protein